MGNWRRARIVGECPADQVDALANAIRFDLYNDKPDQHFGPLTSTGGIAGLPCWAAVHIEAVGNLAERGYDADSVAEELEHLRTIAPGLKVLVHVGGDNESEECVATVDAFADTITVGEPQVKTIEAPTASQMENNLLASLARQMGGRR